MSQARLPQAMKLSRPGAALITICILASAGAFWILRSGHLQGAPTVPEPLYPALNANGDPILGVFEGRIPCADCERTKVALVLYESATTKAPSTYWLARVGVGKTDDRIVTQGTWTTRRGAKDYPEAVVYELDANTPEDLRLYWRVSENVLLPLDRDLNVKAGNASWGYMLSRTR